jgi:hypothetical protein
MPDVTGTLLFLLAVGLSGSKIAGDFGNRGLRGYAMLLVLIVVYSGAVALAFGELR